MRGIVTRNDQCWDIDAQQILGVGTGRGIAIEQAHRA